MDLDDDMFLVDDWYERLCEHDDFEGFELSGFRILNPDGSEYGGYFDAYSNLDNSTFMGDTTYFSSYIAKKELFDVCPYPTYQSGDRAHVVKLAKIHGIDVRKRLLPEVRVVHAGFHMSSKPYLLKRSADYKKVLKIRDALKRKNISWIGFADRYLNFQQAVRYRDVVKVLRNISEREIQELGQKDNWLW